MTLTTARFIEPVTLTGQHASVEPLERDHEAGLREAAKDGSLWELWYTSVPSPETVGSFIDAALAQRDREGAMPFVVREMADGRIVGSTRMFNVLAEHRRLEIGHTWYAKRVQRTPLNTECKLMLLRHAFETLDCIAVEFRTSWFNHQSRRAIERLGAKQDGVLRSHNVMPDGSLRDTVVFSIIACEWPAVRRHLQHQLQRSG
ncbi:MAG TPA: GNAT family protein [Casimicrobiaceae bacterium]|nr:GNAT family protein [Casimicrobiaceae bacterium]